MGVGRGRNPSISESLKMVKRIAAIGFIVVCTSIAWAILGSTIFYRTYSSDELLKGRVSSSWGTPQEQTPPTARYQVVSRRQVASTENGTAEIRAVEEKSWVMLPLEQTRANAALRLDYRKKGLLWYSTYQLDFSGVYRFSNPSDQPQQVTFRMALPASHAVYDDMIFSVDDVPLAIISEKNDAVATALLQPRETAALRVAYRSHGLDNWSYDFGDEVTQVKDFQLHVTTNFPAFDLLENTLSPTEEIRQPNGWDLVWNYRSLMSGYHVGIALPQKLQPGPLAGRISYFAPVSLLFFFFALFLLTTVRGIELHPMNYFFLACAFFSFHLLMAYLVDHLSIHVAFVICSAVSIALLLSYLRVVAGMRGVLLEAGFAHFLYLVLFSYAFFFEGFTGLAITIGAILTLFIAMQTTARIQWAEKFAVR
jgi:inner membrane protein involved in colicin E2 resistance